MKTYSFKALSANEIQKLGVRNADADQKINEKVLEIIEQVKQNGDDALKTFAQNFDQITLENLVLSQEEISALAQISEEEAQAIQTAYQNISTFHQAQLRKEDSIQTMPGVNCWRENRAIERVGLYIPGGTAVLPSTFLMLAIPAKIAGCKEIVVCTPPQKNKKINAYIAYCAQLLGIEKVYLVGGAQAVAAMAYGTETVPKVDKILGPGNQYVTAAKSIIQGNTLTSIDMPAGPSEVLIIADEHANPQFLAADLLAQAEHGVDSQAILVSTSEKIISDTLIELQQQLNVLPRKALAEKAIANSYAIHTENLEEAMQFSNSYAPEHLILAVKNWEYLTPKIVNAGSVFLGNLTPESLGDYASGTNHTLPTSGYARMYSGVSVDTFLKKITFQYVNPEGLKHIGKTVETLAQIEGLDAHKNAVTLRLNSLLS